ncbi:type II toxin-antitoxin system VapC family toxin [Nostoc sp. FACHB-152]|uniref:type II toxin-antitoxin system VapC family toxin n=1 Tax=unclassified Nostoc TaxID=2593658 RepID=UPI0016820EBB|nr:MULTISPECIES: type II toxin-antitoxin system VapC family toxin [unclassified Nostoc]MBD2448826.1 type II toxin-antitoxin system VapC family toxin [Nostoc sp. FACHB-152]MBD2469843.1 type II toxin-antitoxin system VapC family toxin [Nostoc sp. FACHB-145]
MGAIDTNIIVRLLTQDDELQYRKSLEIFQTKNVFIPDTVILETEWVLRFAYKFKSVEIYTAFRKLFGLSNVYLSNAVLVFQALQWHESGLDFADAFHLAQSQNYAIFYTFDEKFVKKTKGLTTCEVNQP